jgi:hypothetical protein
MQELLMFVEPMLPWLLRSSRGSSAFVDTYTMTGSYLEALLVVSGRGSLAYVLMRLIDGLDWEELEKVSVEGITAMDLLNDVKVSKKTGESRENNFATM